MAQLYRFVPQDRSGKVAWLLEELRLDYEIKALNFKESEHLSEEYLNLNPMGHVPTWVDGEVVITESNAIITYLADLHPDKIYTPAITDKQDRADYLTWIHFSESSYEFVLSKYLTLDKMTDEELHDWNDWAHRKVGSLFAMINDVVSKNDYLVSNRFSAADICVAYGLKRIMKDPKASDFPKVIEYFQRVTGREAAKKSGTFDA